MYHCPNCTSIMQTVTADNLKIDHCPHCGGCFFDDQEIDQMTPQIAQMLSKMRVAEAYEVSTKKCPKDDAIMHVMDSISSTKKITALKCPVCNGVFTYSQDLLPFTHLPSSVKDTLNRKPSEAGKLAALYGIGFAMLAGMLFFNPSSQAPQIQAQNQRLQVIHNQKDTTICTRTKNKATSTLEITNGDADVNRIRHINLKPSLLHCIAIDNGELNSQTRFSILLTSGGKTVRADQ